MRGGLIVVWCDNRTVKETERGWSSGITVAKSTSPFFSIKRVEKNFLEKGELVVSWWPRKRGSEHIGGGEPEIKNGDKGWGRGGTKQTVARFVGKHEKKRSD